jgi:hypothetical protein
MVKKKKVKKKSKTASKKANKIVLLKRKEKVWKSFFITVILFVISFILYSVSGNLFANIFYLSSIIFGSLSLAFIIIILVMFFLKLIKK